MREIGIVTELCCDMAKVTVLRRSACGENCASCKGGCTPTMTVITAKNEAGAMCGDRVAVEISDKRALWAAVLVYILPLAALILGAAVGRVLGFGEGFSAVVGFIAMAVCFGIVRFVSEKSRAHYEVRLTKILTKSDPKG